jgi:putative cell wall-binding protein
MRRYRVGTTLAGSSRLATMMVSPANAAPRAVAGGISVADSSSFTTRLAGATRFDTAVAISGQFSAGVPSVYIATGSNFPDALAAGAAAGTQSPVLLVDGADVPDSVVAEVRRLQPGKVIIVGGAAAVPDSVGVELGAYASGGWSRLAGADRYATAVAVSQATFSPGVPVVYLATGANFPDALTGSALGAFGGGPVLLTGRDALPDATSAELTRLQPAQIYVLGGAALISDALIDSLTNSFGPGRAYRVAGGSRYDTNVEADGYVSAPSSTLILATGMNFPDALAGAALAGHLHSLMLFVGAGALDSEQFQFVRAIAPTHVIVLGGTTSVPDAAVNDVLAAAGLIPIPPEEQAADYAVDTTPSGNVDRWNPCQAIVWRLNAPNASDTIIAEIKQAVADVSTASGLVLNYGGTTNFVPTQESYGNVPGQMIVAYLPGLDSDLFAGDPEYGGVGGYDAPDDSGEIYDSFAYINSSEVDSAPAQAAETVIRHELGHAVGLEHAKYPTEIMYPTFGSDSPTNYSVGDNAGLAKVGKPAGCFPK